MRDLFAIIDKTIRTAIDQKDKPEGEAAIRALLRILQANRIEFLVIDAHCPMAGQISKMYQKNETLYDQVQRLTDQVQQLQADLRRFEKQGKAESPAPPNDVPSSSSGDSYPKPRRQAKKGTGRRSPLGSEKYSSENHNLNAKLDDMFPAGSVLHKVAQRYSLTSGYVSTLRNGHARFSKRIGRLIEEDHAYWTLHGRLPET